MKLSAKVLLYALNLVSLFNYELAQDDNSITAPDLSSPFLNPAYSLFRFPKRGRYIRKQKTYLNSFPFPCQNQTVFHLARSKERPTSVHRLRPGDIDVVGAMGDSLVAGNGALEEFALGAIIEYRGVSWCAGGESTWREYLTLPNILKEFNPDLTGYSTGVGEYLASNSHMNVGFPVSSDGDALQQAKFLVNRMRNDPTVDFKRDWKMITIFFGANDLCSAQCYRQNGEDSGPWSPRAHAEKLALALDYLKAKLPRTFVNLIPVLDVSVSVRVKRSMMCRLMHTLFCSCFHRGLGGGGELRNIVAMTRQYQAAEEQLISSGRYDDKEDFTVVIQPFMKLFNAKLGRFGRGPKDSPQPLPRLPEVIDVSYITHDCFHFSQKGHALAANLLWNNLFQPIGNKSSVMMDYIMQKFLCPSERMPYFFTAKNSKTFYQTGHQ